MKKINEQLKVFMTIFALSSSIVLLPGCVSKNKTENPTSEEIVQVNQSIILEPGEHIIKIEERELTTSNLGLTGSDKVGIICPEGYELVTVYAKGNSRNYYVFTNSVPVEVVADENGEFSSFGTPVTTEDLDMQNVTNKIKTR